MGAPDSGMKAAEQPTAEALLTAFRTIKDDERARHAAVLDYWLSIRGDKEFPPLHDLDPLEISDAAPSSILLELIGGGQDAEIRHLGDALTEDVTVQRMIDAPSPSLLSCVARKLPIVAISREFLSFEDNFTNADGLTRCWVTLLPLSSCGSWVDYVYAFVSLEKGSAKAAKPAPKAEAPAAEEVQPEAVTEEPEVTAEEPAVEAEPVAEEPEVTAEESAAEVEPVAEEPEAVAEEPEAVAEEPEAVADEPAAEAGPVAEEPETVAELPEAPEPVVEAAAEVEQPADSIEEPVEEASVVEAVEAELEPPLEPEPEAVTAEEQTPAKDKPGFSGILEGLANLAGFYGQGVKVTDPVVPMELAQSDMVGSEPLPAEPDAIETPEPEEAAAPEPEAAEPPAPEPVAADEQPLELDVPAQPMEGSLQNKLDEVRALADEARQAALRATAALHEGLSAAYDFALDAETSPEEYLRLVEAQGLKIQLRAPMAPVGKLAFDGLVDPATLADAEKLLAWALKVELPRGGLLERIDKAGGIPDLLGEIARAG